MLARIRKSMADKDQGFTLIELLVVIIIIGILAAIAIPVFLNQRKKGVDASLKSDLKNAATAVETWITDHPQTAITGQTVAAAASGTVDSEMGGFKSSPGNTVQLVANTTAGNVGAYCLFGTNAGASKAILSPTAVLAYRSASGGLDAALAGAITCTTP